MKIQNTGNVQEPSDIDTGYDGDDDLEEDTFEQESPITLKESYRKLAILEHFDIKKTQWHHDIHYTLHLITTSLSPSTLSSNHVESLFSDLRSKLEDVLADTSASSQIVPLFSYSSRKGLEKAYMEKNIPSIAHFFNNLFTLLENNGSPQLRQHSAQLRDAIQACYEKGDLVSVFRLSLKSLVELIEHAYQDRVDADMPSKTFMQNAVRDGMSAFRLELAYEAKSFTTVEDTLRAFCEKHFKETPFDITLAAHGAGKSFAHHLVLSTLTSPDKLSLHNLPKTLVHDQGQLEHLRDEIDCLTRLMVFHSAITSTLHSSQIKLGEEVMGMFINQLATFLRHPNSGPLESIAFAKRLLRDYLDSRQIVLPQSQWAQFHHLCEHNLFCTGPIFQLHKDRIGKALVQHFHVSRQTPLNLSVFKLTPIAGAFEHLCKLTSPLLELHHRVYGDHYQREIETKQTAILAHSLVDKSWDADIAGNVISTDTLSCISAFQHSLQKLSGALLTQILQDKPALRSCKQEDLENSYVQPLRYLLASWYPCTSIHWHPQHWIPVSLRPQVDACYADLVECMKRIKADMLGATKRAQQLRNMPTLKTGL